MEFIVIYTLLIFNSDIMICSYDLGNFMIDSSDTEYDMNCDLGAVNQITMNFGPWHNNNSIVSLTLRCSY